MKSLLTKIKEQFVTSTPKIPKNACYLCKRKASDLRNYRDESNKKKLKCVIYVLNMLRDELFVNKYCMPSVLIMEGFYHSRRKKCNGKIKVLI